MPYFDRGVILMMRLHHSEAHHCSCTFPCMQGPLFGRAPSFRSHFVIQAYAVAFMQCKWIFRSAMKCKFVSHCKCMGPTCARRSRSVGDLSACKHIPHSNVLTNTQCYCSDVRPLHLCRQEPATVRGEEATPHQTGVLVVGVGGTVQEVAPMQHQCKLVAMELPMVGKLMEVRLSMRILTVQMYVFGIQCMP